MKFINIDIEQVKFSSTNFGDFPEAKKDGLRLYISI